MKVQYTPAAFAELQSIVAYISARSPRGRAQRARAHQKVDRFLGGFSADRDADQ